MIVKPASAGMLSFDVNQPLSSEQAEDFVNAGYEAVARYIPRTKSLSKGCISQTELNDILNAGLLLYFVQHCPLPTWMPTAELGTEYGQYAVEYAKEVGIPEGVNIYLDLEGVSTSALSKDILTYCETWYDQVALGGFVPGIYVGWKNGLTPGQLFHDLSFEHYWKAYNYDDGVLVRGYQIVQTTQKTLNGITFDPNRIQNDNLGGLPILLSNS